MALPNLEVCTLFLCCALPVNLALKGLLFLPTVSSITCSVSCIERVLFHLDGLGTFFAGWGGDVVFDIKTLCSQNWP